MIQRAPAEVYIRYLLCHPDRYNNDAVKELAAELDLYCPLDRDLNALRRKYKPPTPFYPLNRKHTASMKFLRAAGIYSLFHPDRSTKYAMAILRDAQARMLVEQQLAQRAHPDIILAGLSNRLNFSCSVDGINKYRYLFFSDESTRGEKQQAIDVRAGAWSYATDKDLTPAHLQAERRARYRDGRITALNMPTCAPAQIIIAIQNGYLPKNLRYDVGKGLTDTYFLLINYAQLALMQGGPNAARDAKDYLSAAQIVRTMMETVTTPDDLVRAEFDREIQVVSDTTRPMTIRQLSKGNHTIDMQPINHTEEIAVESDDIDTDVVEEEENEL